MCIKNGGKKTGLNKYLKFFLNTVHNCGPCEEKSACGAKSQFNLCLRDTWRLIKLRWRQWSKKLSNVKEDLNQKFILSFWVRIVAITLNWKLMYFYWEKYSIIYVYKKKKKAVSKHLAPPQFMHPGQLPSLPPPFTWSPLMHKLW